MVSTFNLICMALTTALCLWAGSARRRGLSGTEWRIGRRESWIVAAVLLAGAAMRCVQLWLAQNALLPEEIAIGLQAESLLRSGTDLAGNPWPAALPGWLGEPVGPLYAWMVMPLMAVFGHSALALRLPMLLLQLVCLWTLWDLVRRAFGGRTALWALLLATISPWQLMQSRWAMGWQLLPHLLLLAVWMFARRKRAGWFFGGMAALALSMYTCDAAWYIAPVFALASAVCLWALRAARLRRILPGLLVFALLAAPALYAWAAQTYDLPERRVLGMQVSRVEEYAHAGDGILDKPLDVTSAYGADNLRPQKGYGPQFLPVARGDWKVASLHTALFETGFAALKGTALQYADDPGYTKGYFLPDQGYLYLLSLPLTLLGALRLLRRRRQETENDGEGASARRVTLALLVAWVGAAALFALTHFNLTLTHYAALFYPLLLCTACGAAWVARRARFAGAALLALYLAGLGIFWAQGYDPAPAFPGLQEALAHVHALDAPSVAVTTRLYPHDAPAEIAALETQWAFGLEAAYVRGESGIPGKPAYAERFRYVHFPSHDFEADAGVVYVLHESEEILLNTDLYEIGHFGEFSVAAPR